MNINKLKQIISKKLCHILAGPDSNPYKVVY